MSLESSSPVVGYQPPIRPRPTVGTVTERTVKIPVCIHCGYRIETDMCSDSCPLDCGGHGPSDILHAVYKIREEFMGDT
jgi:hypothetical protein